jgi:hypothetical protein
MISCRDRATKRETRLVGMLQYVSNVAWKHLFGKAADNLERSTENEDEYMIHENSPVTNSFVSVPADMGHLNCAAFIAGIIAGMLDNARFVSLIYIENLPSSFVVLALHYYCLECKSYSSSCSSRKWAR